MKTVEDYARELREVLVNSDNVVFFGGAGVSTESGLKDFRSPDGLYAEKYAYPPEYMLSHTCYERHTKEFFDFYRDKLLVEGIRPNAAHIRLAEWEKLGKVKAVITQNIDGLHQAAGSENVFELHGSVLRNYCDRCGKFYGVEKVRDSEGIPRCDCGGVVKPDVVLYEEGLDQEVMTGAIRAIMRADTLIVAGTSLAVYPAAGLIDYFGGRNLVIVNRDPTPADRRANLVINAKIGEVFARVDLE